MRLNNKQKIVLILATPKNAINFFFNTSSGNELNGWIYLGKNVSLLSEIEKIIGGRKQRIDTGEGLQAAAAALRRPFIDFIGSIAQKENKIAWILTSVSEKNLYSSNLFLMLCYLEILELEVKKTTRGICVFCEEPALIRTIQKNFEKHTDLETQVFNPIQTTIPQLILKKVRLINNKVLFIRSYGKRIFYAKISQIRKISGQTIPTDEPVIAIHSWTDHRSFSIEGSFSEAYYGNLGQILEKNNDKFFYMIDIMGTIPYPEALVKLSKINFRWKLFEDFLNFSDIVRVLYLVHGRKTKEIKDIFFSGHEISILLNEEYAKDKYNNRAEVCALYFFAAQKMARQFSVKTFIYTFENHIWEKMTIEGLRESSPHTKIVGYAHSAVKKTYLPYSLSEAERDLIPVPDIILVNGYQAKEILLESGFEKTDIQIIGSLRYGNLTVIQNKTITEKRYNILVVLSYDLDISLEMIFKCVNAFTGNDNFSVIFKPHPITNPENLMKTFEKLPKKFSFSTKSISTLFETANLVIYNDSAASLEAASLGIPILHIKSDFTIDMNIFEDAKNIPSVSSSHQIGIQSRKILDGEYPSLKEIEMHVKQIFSSVDEQKIVEIIS